MRSKNNKICAVAACFVFTVSFLSETPWSFRLMSRGFHSFQFHERSSNINSIHNNNYNRNDPCWTSLQSSPSSEADDDAVIESIEFETHSSISEIPAEEWNICLTEKGNSSSSSSPFMQHSWFRCLEDSGCVCRETGWIPNHVSIKVNGKICGFAPLYIKSHSMGEFIFDNGWAEAAFANGIEYYPKLLSGVPFTPVTGERILLHPRLKGQHSSKKNKKKISRIRKTFALYLKRLSSKTKFSSVHINFLTDEEATDIAGDLKETDVLLASINKRGPGRYRSVVDDFKSGEADTYLRRTSLQYHWTNSNPRNGGEPYGSFDEFLSCFKSKKRIAVRRERQKIQVDEGIRIDTIVGRDILKHDGLVERMFQIYLSTVQKMIWGRQYLTQEFFELLAKSDFTDNLCFMCARRVSSSGENFQAADVFAGTFNVIKNGVFYGRYWGCLEEVSNLHFETCYWSAIEYCIENGLTRMEPGAGGGDYKWARGFDPTLIHSVHYICHPGLRRAISQYIKFETEENIVLTEYLKQKSVLGNKYNRKETKSI